MEPRCACCGATADVREAVVFDPWGKGNHFYEATPERFCSSCILVQDLGCLPHGEWRIAAHATAGRGAGKPRKRLQEFYSCCGSCVFEALTRMPARRRKELTERLMRYGYLDSFVFIALRTGLSDNVKALLRQDLELFGLMVHANLCGLSPEEYLKAVGK